MIPRIDDIEKEIIRLQDKRDNVMDISRDVIRLSGRCITMMHAEDMNSAAKALKQLSSMIEKMKSSDKGMEYHSQQAYQEYVEAIALYTMVKDGKIPSDKELGIEPIPYLLGLLDSVGELRRKVLESLRKGNLEKAEVYYGFMVEIHDSLLPLRFSSSLVQDFRKKQDVARIQLESASSELLFFQSRKR
jgi:translin